MPKHIFQCQKRTCGRAEELGFTIFRRNMKSVWFLKI